jgi:hypothetical protein
VEKYLCWFANGKPYILYKTMVEKKVRLISCSSNVHGVVDYNSNHYRSMVMDAMRINQGYAGEYSIIDEEPNVDVARFFKLLKYSDKLL